MALPLLGLGQKKAGAGGAWGACLSTSYATALLVQLLGAVELPQGRGCPSSIMRPVTVLVTVMFLCQVVEAPLFDLEVRGIPALQYFGQQVWK